MPDTARAVSPAPSSDESTPAPRSITKAVRSVPAATLKRQGGQAGGKGNAHLGGRGVVSGLRDQLLGCGDHTLSLRHGNRSARDRLGDLLRHGSSPQPVLATHAGTKLHRCALLEQVHQLRAHRPLRPARQDRRAPDSSAGPRCRVLRSERDHSRCRFGGRLRNARAALLAGPAAGPQRGRHRRRASEPHERSRSVHRRGGEYSDRRPMCRNGPPACDRVPGSRSNRRRHEPPKPSLVTLTSEDSRAIVSRCPAGARDGVVTLTRSPTSARERCSRASRAAMS
jgi:hypothetical protein